MENLYVMLLLVSASRQIESGLKMGWIKKSCRSVADEAHLRILNCQQINYFGINKKVLLPIIKKKSACIQRLL